MRIPNLHIPRFARSHLADPGLTPRPKLSAGRLWMPRSRPLGRADFLALVLAVTLAAAVAVALLMQG